MPSVLEFLSFKSNGMFVLCLAARAEVPVEASTVSAFRAGREFGGAGHAVANGGVALAFWGVAIGSAYLTVGKFLW